MKYFLAYLASILLMSQGLLAQIVIYEPFDYPEGPLNGQSSTNEYGLLGAWSADATTIVSTNTLTYGPLPVSGRSLNRMQPGNEFVGSRIVDTTVLNRKGLLNDGSTLWFSLLMGQGRGPTNQPPNLLNVRIGFCLANDTFLTGGGNYCIRDDGPQLGEGLGVYMFRNGSQYGTTYAAKFRDFASGDYVHGIQTGDLYGTNSWNYDEFGLVVGKITWGASNDVIEVYRPSTNLALGSVYSMLSTVSVDQVTFDTLTLTRSDPVVIDEIRFGSSYTNVLGYPGPDEGTVIVLD